MQFYRIWITINCSICLIACRQAKPFKKTTKLIKRRYRTPGNRTGKPTFNEFVTFLIDSRTKLPFDRHWMPYHELCKPCQVHYDFIGHFETLNQDADYVLNKMGLHNVSLFHNHPSKKSASSLVAEKLSNLSQDQIRNLTDIYQLDFLLFGYSPELQS